LRQDDVVGACCAGRVAEAQARFDARSSARQLLQTSARAFASWWLQELGPTPTDGEISRLNFRTVSARVSRL
jgi:hypothetical protein